MKPYFADVLRQVRLIRACVSWIGTPFIEFQRVPGSGVDCVQLAGAVYIETGLIDRFEPAPYNLDGSIHSDVSAVTNWLVDSRRFIPSALEAPAVGDLLAFRNGRCAHHVGLVIATHGADAGFVHALRDRGVHVSRLRAGEYDKRLCAIWRPVE